MNMNKIDILLGMKNIQRLPNTPHHKGYNLLEHCYIVGTLFRWFASEEDISYNMSVFDKVSLHDYVESVTGDLNSLVKNHSDKTREAWSVIEKEISDSILELQPYTDENIRGTLSPLQYALFKMCDYLCLWIFCNQELALGNTSKRLIQCIKNCEAAFVRISENWNKFNSIKKFIEKYEA